ncbi:MAG: hypothetical protein IJ379_04510, partial [Lachnospiraceae bacterium]|nr:hypothetical protein [Lachnospiraceae bacterium]
MQQWNISDLREGFYSIIGDCPKLEMSLNKLILETTDTHVLDLIGESQGKDKVKSGAFWRVDVDEDNTFTLEEVKVLYGGALVEREVFIKEDYFCNKEAGNIAYAKAVRELQDKSNAYNHKKQFKNTDSYNTHSYVLVEKRQDGVPVVKWITFEYVYYADIQKYQEHDSKNICEVPVDFEQKPYTSFDVYRMLRHPVMYGSPVHLTKVHVDADIFYISDNGERSAYHLDEIYEDYDWFLEALQDLEKEFATLNKKNKWRSLAGMDIEKMNELASYLAMEVYFAQGYKGIHGESVSPLEQKKSETMVQYLERQESYEDYITLLTSKLVGLDSGIVKKAFQYLKENSDEKPLEIAHKFVKPHINGRYEVGKVYFAEVIEVSLGRIGAERDA